jgi:ribonuclease HI
MSEGQKALPKVTIVCDGGSTPNPGVGGWGAVLRFEGPRQGQLEAILLPGDKRQLIVSGHADYATNNEMEMAAVLGGINALGGVAYEVLVKTDSGLVIRYMTTTLKSGGVPNLLMARDLIREAVRAVGHQVSFQKADRNETAVAHRLAEAEMKKVPSKPVPMKME